MYISIFLLVLGVQIRQHHLALVCNNAFDCVTKLRREVVLESCNIVVDNAEARHYTNSLLKLLDTAQHFNGNGYFQVKLKKNIKL